MLIFHIDMDAFFAAIEQRDNPSCRGKPVIVGAKPGTRGVVCAASYEARRFGVRSAMPISEAVKRCPQGIFLRPRHYAYVNESHAVMRILADYSPLIEQVSVDEAFLDMTGSGRLFGRPRKTAEKIASRIRKELSLTASIGIAPNKFIAKIASDMNKPSGITEAPFEQQEIEEWLAPLPVGRIWGIGRKTETTLSKMGIRTVADLQQMSRESLERRFGMQGEDLFELCRGIDDRPVCDERGIKSISREHTFPKDSYDREEWLQVLFSLAQDVARQARENGVKGRTVVLSWRSVDFGRHSRRKRLPCPANVAKIIFEGGTELLSAIDERALRLIGIGITGLDPEEQTDLFADERSLKTLEKAEAAADAISRKFGDGVIGKGREMCG